MKVYAQRPQHGCARCFWWNKHKRDNWGRCACQLGVTTWWQHGPCDEYEYDDNVPEHIELVPDAA